jgi:hypothetical protein
MQIGGDIITRGVILFPIMSLKIREKRHEYKETEQRHGDRERS